MKGLKLFLAACFVVPMFDGAMAADTPRSTTRTTQSGRGNATVSVTRKPAQQTTRKERNTTSNVTPRTASSKNVVTRNIQKTTSEKSRTATVAPRTKPAVTARTTRKPNALTRATNAIFSRVATKKTSKSRAATTPTRESVMQRNFSKCKTVFFECMDEFCAQKNAQLKRCACSARAGEFTAVQKSLDAVEDKLLDFSQHLLKVNMDPADAAAINIESEGERAYNETKDKTASKKMLDEIAKKLNTDFSSAENGTGMGALSWSLNADAAFDSVDSLGGTSTTAKSGTALRNAALPICREMAAEVCSDDDISLVENSYTMAIEQDCNTVKKAYETQTQAARTKVLEGSALLDMTRLNTYQDNNSDDILTCKSKMLDMLSNTSVCGENLTKCLDISGRYINPTTGEALLSPDLINLSTLIVRPSSTDTWAHVPANASFVTYLNSKKTYLESATKNCQEIADSVWNTFIEDALAKIKLAQNAKLEEVRQSCTTLLSECLEKANENLSNFDSRALSTFGVVTDRTANAMCEKVKTSCTAIVEYIPDESASTPNFAGITESWNNSTTNIAAMQTYDRIINTCREIGRDCIINSCKSITGNFGLCESIHGSVNRHSILSRAACWDEVYNCVAAASDESINAIHSLLYTDNMDALYTDMYNRTPSYYQHSADSGDLPNNQVPVNPLCSNECQTNNNQDDTLSTPINCYKCRLTEQIWGNCAKNPQNDVFNPILMPSDPSKTTLLSWFANNTHTATQPDSCSVSMCPAGTFDYTTQNGVVCLAANEVINCHTEYMQCRHRFDVNSTIPIQNCCNTNSQDSFGNCCQNHVSTEMRFVNQGTSGSTYPTQPTDLTSSSKLCVKTGSAVTLLYATGNKRIFCAGQLSGFTADDTTQDQIRCDGDIITLEKIGTTWYYNYPQYTNDSNNPDHYTNRYNINQFVAYDTNNNCDYYHSEYNQDQHSVCKWTKNTDDTWSWDGDTECDNVTPTNWRIQYPQSTGGTTTLQETAYAG